MYLLVFTDTYQESYKKIIKEDQEKAKRIQKALTLLQQDPFYPSLKSHKVATRNFGQKWSSWISGDLCIIWDFDPEQQLVILLLALTLHSGAHKEYK